VRVQGVDVDGVMVASMASLPKVFDLIYIIEMG
jgi:hypothetical protein